MSSVNVNKTSRINSLLDKVRTKLQDFEVKNLQGKTLGTVRSLRIDPERHIILIVSPLNPEAGDGRFQVNSKHIQKVDPMARSLFIDTERADIEYLQPQNTPEIQSASTSTQTMTPPTHSEGSDSLLSPETPAPNNDLLEGESINNFEDESLSDETELPKVVEEEIIRLLEEKLVVNRSKRKVAEVVVRKEIETRMVEVPVRREKLIVEQIGDDPKQLAEFDLGDGEITGIDLNNLPKSETQTETRPTVRGEFVSPQAVSDLLEAIATQRNHGCAKIRIELVLSDPKHQETYQQMFDRCSRR
jgi:uncharacterized protein (TIGR02271 family)